MWVRVTIDREFVIHAIEAVTDGMPYPGACNRIGPAYQKLVGANLIRGFRKDLHDVLGGVQGCTHLTELLAFLPTAAVQTFAGHQREDDDDGKPFQLDRCHALETTEPKPFRAVLTPQAGIAGPNRRRESDMKIHEYQAKEILRRYGVPTPRGVPAFSVDEAVKAAQSLGGKVWVVKAQIHAGGRGKGGGVKVAKSLDEVRQRATRSSACS